MNSVLRSVLIKIIKMVEVSVMTIDDTGKIDVFESTLDDIGLTMKDMYNLQQLRIKLEHKTKHNERY